MVGPLYTELTLSGWPGSPVVPAPESSAPTDTWSISIVDISTTSTNVVIDLTELGANGVSVTVHLYDDKPYTVTLPVPTVDTWFAQWNETPFDQIQIDTGDVWRITYANELSSAVIQQTFPAIEVWSLTWTENSTLSVSSALTTVAVNDPWQITFVESAALFKDVQVADTWSITYSTELSSPLNSAGTIDTWSLTYSPESSAVAAGGVFVVAPVDTWSISIADSSALAPTLFLTSVDTWSISQVEVANIIAGNALDLADTWSIVWSEQPAQVAATPMFSDIADNWNLSFQLESSSIANIPTIPILTSDQWSITFIEASSIIPSTITVPRGRLIKVGGTKRHVITVE